tara:strand:+ start:366 stop:779 length:414 start_codon:yes stop_codon:yes gene_type:complete
MSWQDILKVYARPMPSREDNWADIADEVVREINYPGEDEPEGNDKACYLDLDDFQFNITTDDSSEEIAIKVEPEGEIKVIDDDTGKTIKTIDSSEVDYTIEIDSRQEERDATQIELSVEYYLESYHEGKLYVSVVLG